MANTFDQFDSSPAVAANPFDQFDGGNPFDKFDAKSPYTDLIAESVDLNRRAAKATPERIGREAVVTDDDIKWATQLPIGIGGLTLPQAVVEPLITNAPRVMAPLGAALAATGVGTVPGLAMVAAAGGLGEFASQALEKEMGQREGYSIPQIATGTLLSGIPAARLTGIASPLARGVIRVGEGALIGGAAPAVQAGLEGRLPDIGDVGRGAAFGSVLGAPFGALEAAGGRLARTPSPLLPEIAQPGSALPESSIAKVTELAKRMEGKSVEQQKAILDQEVKLQKDTLTQAEQRAALDAQQSLDAQIKAKRDAEAAVKDAEKAQADQAKAVEDAQKMAAEANKPAEIPKSQQILNEPQTKPPSLANISTDIATHTEGSPFALQGKLNEFTAAKPPPQVAPQAGLPGISEAGAAPVMPKPARPMTPEATIKHVAKLGPEEFHDWSRQQPEGTTGESYKVGIEAIDKPDILAALRAGRDKAEAQFKAALAKSRKGTPEQQAKALDDATGLSGKVQFFSEAIGAAENSGSASRSPLVQAAHAAKQPETIASAAVKFSDGEIRTGRNHASIVDAIGEKDLRGSDDGFVTSTGRYVTREEAMKIAKKAEQVENKPSKGPEKMFAEHLDPQMRVLPKEKGLTVEDIKTPKGEPQNAIQEPSPSPLPVRNPPEDGQGVGGSNVVDQGASQARPAQPKENVEGLPGDVPKEGVIPSAEQRLNDAGTDLPPVSSMKRPALRAELRAAGITKTPKGIPIEDANAAQLMDAVGKLRRGQFGSERGAILVPGGKKQTDTPEFKAWFGESKVVDADGKPMVVYKAMYPNNWDSPAMEDITSINRPSEFPAFNKGEKGVKIAGFFGDIPTANRFADGSAGNGQAIFPVYLSFKKPFVIEADGRFAGDVQFGESGKEFRQAIRSGEYDGVIIKNTKDEGTVYVALKPEQIKSAIGNRGTFDPNNPDIRAAINPAVLAPLAGAGGGAAYGATQGDSPEERIRNAALYGSIGLAGGSLSGALLNKAISKPVRSYQAPVLKDVAKMLTPIEQKAGLFEKLSDAYGNFRYRFNTRFAPIGEAQQQLYKNTGRTFTPSRYYDLERGFERLAGAPVQAEAEVELLQNVIDKLAKKDVPHFDTYLTLSRIKDRLTKTSEANDQLMDAVGRAQAEVDAAVAANQAKPGVRNSASVLSKREELKLATKKLNEEFDRKRVADWSIAKADTGLQELEATIGQDAFQRLTNAGQEYQDVMRRSLQIQVDSGRMSQDLMDRVLATNDFYAPFKVLKHYEDEEGFLRGGGMRRIPSSEQLVKKITGIDDLDVRIGSPTDVAAEQVYKGYILAQKNRKLRELATLTKLDPAGDYVRPLPEGMDPRKGYEALTYFVNGQPKRLEVSRPISNALTGLDASETDIILRGLGRFAGAFKLGATGLSIPFNLSNALVFDPIRLSTISRYGFRGPQDFLYTLYEWPKALFSSARGNLGQAVGMTPDLLYEQWIKSGAANSTLARVMTPEAFSSRLPRDVKTGEVLAQNNLGLGAPIKVAALISNTLEETTKLWGLQRAMRIDRLDKLSPADRARKWDEIVTEIRNYAGSPDFARAGVSIRPLNILLPFTNPRWQGFTADFARLNPFRQGNKQDAAAAWARLGTLVGLPAAGLAYYNLSTPENERDFLQIPKSEREKYFHIPLQTGPDGKPTVMDTGKPYYFNNKDGVSIRGYYRIPKREFPGLMANTIEDFMEYAKGSDPQTFAEIGANFTDNAAQTASPLSIQGDTFGERALSAASGVNPAIRLPVEVGLNQNLYTGRAIVPQGREKASPGLQYAENTPEVYKRAAGALPDILPEALQSPAKLQHITEGLTGGFSRQFASPKLSPGNPAGGASPLLGRFYRSERVESEDLIKGANEAERARADQRIAGQEVASKMADVIQSKPTPEAKQKALNDAIQAGLLNKESLGYLREELTDAQRGLTYEDRVIKRSYSVAGGFRANYYIDKVKDMAPAEREAYLSDQHRKGLLTKDVIKQIAQAQSQAR